jgi:hypothetical protein
MLARIGLAFCVLVLSGCTSGPGGIDCHATHWYRMGLNDGMQDAKGEVEGYAARCGAEFDRANYEIGFRDGLARRPKPPAQQ